MPFYMNIYGRFISLSILVSWIISDPLVHKGLKNGKFSHVVHSHSQGLDYAFSFIK